MCPFGMKSAASFVIGCLSGILAAKSGVIDAAIGKLAKIQVPSINLPANPLTMSLGFLLKLPSLNFGAFAIMLLIFVGLSWWLAKPNVRRVLVAVALMIVWAIISLVI
jgi:hypothetical protein